MREPSKIFSRLRGLALALALHTVACERSQPAPAGRQRGELLVFAAASLRDAFTTLAPTFEARHPQAEVRFHFAGSQELRAQIARGAPADVFASADVRPMQALAQAGHVRAPQRFARNEPVVVVARERAASLESLAELPSAARIVLGAPEVPIGRYALEILELAGSRYGPDFRARVEAKVVSRELSVRQVLSKVSLGEAEAGIVYRTDARHAERSVSSVAIPFELNVIAEYPIAVVTSAPHPELARAWVALVLGPEGRAQLEAAGFLPPDPAEARR